MKSLGKPSWELLHKHLFFVTKISLNVQHLEQIDLAHSLPNVLVLLRASGKLNSKWTGFPGISAQEKKRVPSAS